MSNSDKQNLIKNSGCCGAVSDAWVPSYPSLSTSTDISLNDNQSSPSLSAESDSSSLVSYNSNNLLRSSNSLIESEDK